MTDRTIDDAHLWEFFAEDDPSGDFIDCPEVSFSFDDTEIFQLLDLTSQRGFFEIERREATLPELPALLFVEAEDDSSQTTITFEGLLPETRRLDWPAAREFPFIAGLDTEDEES
jgi:hypothetical protein